eukprot:6590751-Heterocapsa_arctica.AAC.1
MAAQVLDQRSSAEGNTPLKAGASPVEVQTTDWSRGFPGVALVTWQGQPWRALGYGDKLDLDADVCDLMHLPAQQ